MTRLPVVALLLLWPGLGLAAPAPTALLASQIDDGPARLGASVQVRRGQRVTIWAVLRVGHRYFTDAPALVASRRLPAARVRPFAELPGASFSWLQVEPEPYHVKLPSPNPGNPAYSNAVLFGKQHGRWLGYDRIEYLEKAVAGETRPSLALRRVRPGNPKLDVHEGLGTMRFKVLIAVDGQVHASPGADAVGAQGIQPTVLRVSFRESDDLVGWMSAYFNVPNVFGSGGDGRTHQAELFQGTDCADVITGAARLAGARLDYTSVLGLQRYAKPVTRPLLLDATGIYELEDGEKGQPISLSFGGDVRRGDIMLIDYVGFDGSPRSWDHVAVVGRDRGKPGVLDPRDILLHMGYMSGLVEAEAHTEGPARVQFLRFRPSLRVR